MWDSHRSGHEENVGFEVLTEVIMKKMLDLRFSQK
jgi:hypothetical protein